MEDIWRCDEDELRALTQQAAASPRLRTHLLMHDGHNDQVQRLLIAGQPGTYVRPHVHSESWELLALLRGAGRLFRFDDDGALAGIVEMRAGEAALVQIAPGKPHGFAVTEPDTVLMEVKPGPYCPNEFLDWTAEEGTSEAADFVRWSLTAGKGDSWATGRS
jgi:cupin fold WbuC family metalloprotein